MTGQGDAILRILSKHMESSNSQWPLIIHLVRDDRDQIKTASADTHKSSVLDAHPVNFFFKISISSIGPW